MDEVIIILGLNLGLFTFVLPRRYINCKCKWRRFLKKFKPRTFISSTTSNSTSIISLQLWFNKIQHVQTTWLTITCLCISRWLKNSHGFSDLRWVHIALELNFTERTSFNGLLYSLNLRHGLTNTNSFSKFIGNNGMGNVENMKGKV